MHVFSCLGDFYINRSILVVVQFIVKFYSEKIYKSLDLLSSILQTWVINNMKICTFILMMENIPLDTAKVRSLCYEGVVKISLFKESSYFISPRDLMALPLIV